MDVYKQKDLEQAAPSDVRAGITVTPDSWRKIPVPTGVLDSIKLSHTAPSPEDILCGLEDASGLSAFRVGTRDMARMALHKGNGVVPSGIDLGNYEGGPLGKIELKTAPIDDTRKGPKAFTMPD